MEEKDNTERVPLRKTPKVEVSLETVGKEKFTIVKTGEITTRINREKLHNALQSMIRDQSLRARLESDPVQAMAEMGIELDNKEKMAIAGKRLSQVFALLGKTDPEIRGAVGFFPESIVEVIISTISTGPETATATVSGAVTDVGVLAGVETAGEETVVVLAVTL
jgi:hypothetical protein